MMAGRHVLKARHEVRFGTRELLFFAAAFLLICALTFMFGVLIGREMAPAGGSKTAAGAPSRSEAVPGKATPMRTEERLTFYKTLTAPTSDLPAVGRPSPSVVEERILPREEPMVRAAGDPGEAPERRPSPPRIEPKPRSRPPTVAPGAPGSRPVAIAPPAPSSPPSLEPPPAGSSEPQIWTIQVSSFRSRTLAEELRARLAARGLDAYLLSAATEEGRVRYRVRVGAYPTRAEAERVAADLRSERNLSPFVTLRPQ